MPLKLSLKPGEKFVLNGAVVQNGDRRGVLVLQNKASVLREKDIMQEEDVNTPARRIYFPVMMMYLDEAGAERYYDEFVRRLTEFMNVIGNPEILTECCWKSPQLYGAGILQGADAVPEAYGIRRREVGACPFTLTIGRRRGLKAPVRWNTVCLRR